MLLPFDVMAVILNMCDPSVYCLLCEALGLPNLYRIGVADFDTDVMYNDLQRAGHSDKEAWHLTMAARRPVEPLEKAAHCEYKRFMREGCTEWEAWVLACKVTGYE